MTEENNNQETTTEKEALKVDTMFLVIKDHNGQYQAISDVSQPVNADRSANIGDVRLGCQEIVRAIDIRQTADTVVGLLNSAQNKDSE